MKRLLLTLFCLALTACEPNATNSSTKSATEIKETTNHSWAKHGLNDAEQRHSPLKQINPNTIESLGLDWSFDMTTRRGVEATPLVIDGVMYVSGGWSTVYALNAKTGQQLWSHDPQVDRSFLSKGCCDAVNRGVAFEDNKVFIGAYDGRLIALDAEDGSVLWEVQTTDRTQSYTITGAPRIIKNLVIIGNGGAELGVRGYVSAYDIQTGEMAWRFYTIPGNPADGFEQAILAEAAKTWNGEWWKWGGGGTVWDSMAYDSELDLLYIGVGNGSPWNHQLRSPGGGDNLFLSSIVALKPDTGEYVWHYQTTPGESWDYTATQHMILADLTIEGTVRKVLMQAPKNGFFYVLDRASGELISANNYAPINWATGIDLATGRPIENPEVRDFENGPTVLPGAGGAHNWPPMSFNPDAGLVYIPTHQFPMGYVAPTKDIDTQPMQGKWNLGFDTLAMAPPEMLGLSDMLAKHYVGRLVAWDPVTQTERWGVAMDRPNASGVLSTAGNLVFQADGFGYLKAYNATSGAELWSHWTQTGAMAPPISYQIDGEQYIAIAVGWGGGFGSQGGIVAEPYEMKNRSRVLVYKLGGTHTLPATSDLKKVLNKPQPVTASAEDVLSGKILFQRHCAYCHGDRARSGGINPDLRYSNDGIHNIWKSIVIDGILQSAGMISFKEYLNEADAENIRQYILHEANLTYQEEHNSPEK